MANNDIITYHINISDLPNDMLYAIFRLIDTIELMPLSLVCKQWSRLILRLRKVVDLGTKYHAELEPTLTKILYDAPLLHTFSIADLGAAVNRVIPILTENCPHLSVLKLSHCPAINEKSWQLIGAAPWPRPTHLSLPRCGINNGVLTTILPKLSTLSVLNITGNDDITDDGILCIVGHTPNLQCLLLHEIYKLTSGSTVPLLNAVGLHLTQLSLSRPDSDLLEALPTACACLRVLALKLFNSPINAVALCVLRLTHLTHLQLVFGSDSIHDFFEAVGSGLSRLEHLALVGGSVGRYVLQHITRKCGSRLRHLSIESTGSIWVTGFTRFADRCNAIEHLELDLHRTGGMNSVIIEAVSSLRHLRIFVFHAEDSKIQALEKKLTDKLPNNVLVCSRNDFYDQDEYKRRRLPNISCTVLQCDSFK